MLTALFWKKVWSWVKHYWYFPVIIVLLVFAFISGSSAKEKLFNLLLEQKENHKKEIDLINGINAEKEEIERIEKEHDIKIQDLEEEKQEELLSTIEEKKDKPDDLAKDIAALLGAKHVE